MNSVKFLELMTHLVRKGDNEAMTMALDLLKEEQPVSAVETQEPPKNFKIKTLGHKPNREDAKAYKGTYLIHGGYRTRYGTDPQKYNPAVADKIIKEGKGIACGSIIKVVNSKKSIGGGVGQYEGCTMLVTHLDVSKKDSLTFVKTDSVEDYYVGVHGFIVDSNGQLTESAMISINHVKMLKRA